MSFVILPKLRKVDLKKYISKYFYNFHEEDKIFLTEIQLPLLIDFVNHWLICSSIILGDICQLYK